MAMKIRGYDFYHIDVFDMMLGSQKHDGLLGLLDDACEEMQQQGILVYRATSEILRLQTYNAWEASNSSLTS